MTPSIGPVVSSPSQYGSSCGQHFSCHSVWFSDIPLLFQLLPVQSQLVPVGSQYGSDMGTASPIIIQCGSSCSHFPSLWFQSLPVYPSCHQHVPSHSQLSSAAFRLIAVAHSLSQSPSMQSQLLPVCSSMIPVLLSMVPVAPSSCQCDPSCSQLPLA